MQEVHYIICDNGDGSQSVEWYKGADFTAEQLIEAAEKDKYEQYASGDGVQLTTLEFPDNFNLEDISGINWKNLLPGDYDFVYNRYLSAEKTAQRKREQPSVDCCDPSPMTVWASVN